MNDIRNWLLAVKNFNKQKKQNELKSHYFIKTKKVATWILGCSNRIGESSSKFKPISLVSFTVLTILDGPAEPNGKWFSWFRR